MARTCLLLCDFEPDILAYLAEDVRDTVVANATRVLSAVREANAARESPVLVVFITVGFRPGYPEISAANKMFSGIKAAGADKVYLIEGTPGASVLESMAPRAGEIVVNKRRVGAFSTTDLETVLRAHGVDHLVLAGVSTSGVILSTVRYAADRDYKLTVLEDCCADRDPEVHRVLTEKVFLRQASVVAADEFLASLASI